MQLLEIHGNDNLFNDIHAIKDNMVLHERYDAFTLITRFAATPAPLMPPAHYSLNPGCRMTEEQLSSLVPMLQAQSPLCRLSNMEGRTVLELLLQRGYTIRRRPMSEAVRFSETLVARCQPEVTAAIDQAARRKGSKPAEYVRQAVLAALRADGLDPAQSQPSAPARCTTL